MSSWVSGTLGDHGIAIMSQREGLAFSSTIESDAAPLNHLIADVLSAAPDTRCFRDPTRGGLASTLNEFAQASGVAMEIDEDDVPVRPDVQAACEMLGYDVLQVANEGKMVAVVPAEQADAALSAMRAARYGEKKGKKHIITTAFEHHAVLHTLAKLEKEGFEVTYLDVRKGHNVTAQQVKDAIRPDTCLVTTMYANNEIGSILPIAEIGAVCKEAGVPFHTDAVQAVGHLHINVKEQNIDMLSLSGHKFHGPKGIGALYIRKGVRPDVFMHGGAQERAQRAGTENLAGIVGMGKAIELATQNLEANAARMTRLRDKLIDGILAEIPEVRLNGHRTERLPNNVNVSIRYIEGEALLLRLDLAGIAGSSGSACTSGSLDPSHVLLAIGRPHEVAHGSLRLSLCEWNTQEEVDHILREVPRVVEYLRSMSPVWKDLESGKKAFML